MREKPYEGAFAEGAFAEGEFAEGSARRYTVSARTRCQRVSRYTVSAREGAMHWILTACVPKASTQEDTVRGLLGFE